MSKRQLNPNPLENIFRSPSRQFLIAVQADGHAPSLVKDEQQPFRKTVRELRGMVKQHREANADVTVERIPEVFCYRITPADGTPSFNLFCCPVELLGVEAAPKPERIVKEKAIDPEKEAAKAAKTAEREKAKAAKAVEREAAKTARLEAQAAKAAEKAAAAAAKAKAASATSGSEAALPDLVLDTIGDLPVDMADQLTESLAEAMAAADGSHDA